MTYIKPSGFTPSESRLQRELSQGKSLSYAAKELGVAVTTIRAMVASMKEKSGATTIQELTQFLPLGLNRRPASSYRGELAMPTDPDLHFYRLLGPERLGTSCKRPGCMVGAIEYSVLCRAHHFEVIKGHPCPYQGDA